MAWRMMGVCSPPGITPNFTGQRLDDTGLLFYNARYYDPMLGRFVSADWIVPGAPGLTVHPFGSVAGGTWGKDGGGPANAQDLNRYSYALNNPVRNTDPSGHCGDAPKATPTPGSTAGCGSSNRGSQGGSGGSGGGGGRGTGGTSNSQNTTSSAHTDISLDAARKTIVDAFTSVLKRITGFNSNGRPVLVDSSMSLKGQSPDSLANGLRGQGINARSVNEVFGRDPGDPAIRSFANAIDARIATRDIGRDILKGGGLGDRAIRVDPRIQSFENVLQIISRAVGPK
jgi:RHS repeat-associated protein